MGNAQLHTQAMTVIRLHPELTDEEVAERCGILPHVLVSSGPGTPLDTICQARKSYKADHDYEERTDHGGDAGWSRK